ncbi:MAG: helix-turn-helix transcriptional regulator [Spirochaetes bacterium]|nr:helix-turn-helix transcriptional regulator [Spirochaetota bacterium]
MSMTGGRNRNSIGLYSEDMTFGTEHPFRLYVRVTPPGAREVRAHFHPSAEIVYFFDAKGAVTIDGVRYRYAQGRLIVIRPYALHAYRFDSVRQKHIILRVDARAASDLFHNSLLEQIVRPFFARLYTLDPVQRIDRDGVKRIIALDDSSPTARIGSLLSLEPLFTSFRQGTQPMDTFDAVKVMDYLESHYAEKVTLTGIAETIGEHPSTLSRHFSSAYPGGFPEFLARIRVGKAKELLAHTGKQVSDVAYSVGFADAAHFTKTFRKYTGVLPRDYRKGAQR